VGKKSRKRQPARNDAHWTANDVRGIIHNPVYVGIGPYPPLIDEAIWIAAQEREIRDDGARAVLGQIRQTVETTLGSVPEWMSQPDWLETAASECASEGVRPFFSRFLQALRAAYA
jgi:hypothetical protein